MLPVFCQCSVISHGLLSPGVLELWVQRRVRTQLWLRHAEQVSRPWGRTPLLCPFSIRLTPCLSIPLIVKDQESKTLFHFLLSFELVEWDLGNFLKCKSLCSCCRSVTTLRTATVIMAGLLHSARMRAMGAAWTAAPHGTVGQGCLRGGKV